MNRGVDTAEIERVIIRALDEKLNSMESVLNRHRQPATATAVQTAEPKTITDSTSFSLTGYLREQGLEWIDKRKSGGTLWVVGGWELNKVLFPLKERKIYFRFTPKGGRATHRQPSWYLMNKKTDGF